MISEFNITIDRLMNDLDGRKLAYSELNSGLGFILKLPHLDANMITLHAQNIERYPNDLELYFINECFHLIQFLRKEKKEGTEYSGFTSNHSVKKSQVFISQH